MDNFRNLNLELEKKFNFGVVIPEKIYRSAQPDPEFLEYLKRQYGIKTALNLRIRIDEKEKEIAKKNDIRLIQLPIKSWRRWLGSKEIEDFLTLLKNPENYPVLIHCRKGKDRTSVIVALYRLRHKNRTLKETLKEMKQWKASRLSRLFIRAEANRTLQGIFSYLKRVTNLIFGLEGLIFAIQNEKNIKIFLVIEAILLGIAWWQEVTIIEFTILLFSLGTFNVLEMFNSAVERLADIVQPQFDYRIKIIKDLLSGGLIFIGMILLVVWLVLVFF